MSIHFVPTISGGVLLSRLGEVHRDDGGQTVCGLKIPPGRNAVVSHVQAIVFKLALCGTCYPAHHDRHTRAKEFSGRRAA